MYLSKGDAPCFKRTFAASTVKCSLARKPDMQATMCSGSDPSHRLLTCVGL